MWQNSKTQNFTKLKNLKCDNSKIEMWQNSKTQNMTILKKTQNVTTQIFDMWQNSKTQKITI